MLEKNDKPGLTLWPWSYQKTQTWKVALAKLSGSPASDQHEGNNKSSKLTWKTNTIHENSSVLNFWRWVFRHLGCTQNPSWKPALYRLIMYYRLIHVDLFRFSYRPCKLRKHRSFIGKPIWIDACNIVWHLRVHAQILYAFSNWLSIFKIFTRLAPPYMPTLSWKRILKFK